MLSNAGYKRFCLSGCDWPFRILLLLTLLILSFPPRILADETSPTQDIFALSLDEVLDIRVDAKNWDGRFQSGIYIVDTRAWARYLRKETRRHNENALPSEGETLLLIDGSEVGPVEEFADLYGYSRFLRSINHVELYIGESSAWWGKGRFPVVVNIVTNPADLAADEGADVRKEVIR